MSEQSFHQKIVNQCSSVMFDIKPSNLLILEDMEESILYDTIHRLNLSCHLFYRGSRTIWFVYRPERLVEYLMDEDVCDFFKEEGYPIDQISLSTLISLAARRFAEHKKGNAEYPHEIGLLLGYPLCDVKGFIENEGNDYLYSGYWKVYANENETRKVFDLYRKVKQHANELLHAQVPLWEICRCRSFTIPMEYAG